MILYLEVNIQQRNSFFTKAPIFLTEDFGTKTNKAVNVLKEEIVHKYIPLPWKMKVGHIFVRIIF